jgi:hypothetical protein
MALAQPRLLLVPEEQAAARLADLAALLKVGFLVESHSLGGEGVREFMALWRLQVARELGKPLSAKQPRARCRLKLEVHRGSPF